MKKIVSVILSVLIISSISISAFADVAYEPSDSFYKSHADECEYYNQECYANSEDGFVTVWKDPTAKASSGTISNGTETYASYTYQDWAYIEYYNGSDQLTGWVLTNDLIEVYDAESFIEEYSNELSEDNGTFNELKEHPFIGENIYLYTYPGSGIIASTIPVEDIINEENLYFDYIYTDDDGNIWGYVSYFMGNRNSWVCVSDPENGALPQTLDKSQELYETKDVPSDYNPAAPEQAVKSNSTTNVIIAAIAACCLVIAFVAVYSRKKADEIRASQKKAQKKKKKK